MSLTSYGVRLCRVHLVIESIAAGDLRPSSITLHVADASFVRRPPELLQRQVARGLRLVSVPDWGAHKKYLPSVLDPRRDPRTPLVTSDDDVLHSRRWLTDLVAVHRHEPNSTIAHRARRMVLDSSGVAPYAQWPLVDTTRASFRHVATGVGGVLHPTSMVDALRQLGADHPPEVARCDDLWLHWVGVRTGVRVRQVEARPARPLALPGLGDESLMHDNVVGGGNDRAVQTLYGRSEIARLRVDRPER